MNDLQCDDDDDDNGLPHLQTMKHFGTFLWSNVHHTRNTVLFIALVCVLCVCCYKLFIIGQNTGDALTLHSGKRNNTTFFVQPEHIFQALQSNRSPQELKKKKKLEHRENSLLISSREMCILCTPYNRITYSIICFFLQTSITFLLLKYCRINKSKWLSL